MPYEPYEYLDEQLGFRQQTTGHRPKQRLPQRDILAAAQAERQAEREARARQRNFQGTPRLTPDALPSVRQRPASQEDDDLYTRAPRSAVRYQPEFEEVYQQGNTRLYAGEVVVPKKRRSAETYLSPGARVQPQQEMYDDVDEQVPEHTSHRRRQPMRFHSLVWLGIGMIVMILLWIGFSNLLNWWQIHQDDATYGSPRTFQIDAAVGVRRFGAHEISPRGR